MVIGITGTNGSGKGTVVEYLVSKGFVHYSVRDAIVEEIKRRGLLVDRSAMRAVANDLRKTHGPAYFTKLFSARAAEEGVTDYIVESIRNVAEAEAFKAIGGVLIATDADRRLRHERIVARGSATDHVTFEQFCEQEDRELDAPDAWDMSVLGVMKRADATIQNDGTPDELRTRVDQALAALKK